MTDSRTRSGQPLVVLGAILALWLVGRALLWQTPFPLQLPPLPELVERLGGATTASAARVDGNDPVSRPDPLARASIMPQPPLAEPAMPFALYDPAALSSRGAPLDMSTAHQLMWLAALGDPVLASPAMRPGVPTLPLAFPVTVAGSPAVGAANPARPDRWSFSGWLFVREGSGGGVTGGVQPASYGASQAGGVLRYRLRPGSGPDPAAYLRVTGALQQSDDREAALGLALRPLKRVPVAVLGEGRMRERAGRAAVRPAVLAVTELAPLDLPHGLKAELYAQAGYVGGRDATAFADGQVRLTGPVAAFNLGTVRAGGGVWGGAQQGAARLDLGPSAQVDLALAGTPVRLAVDYRVRLAGDAQPGSGVALTLSTGF